MVYTRYGHCHHLSVECLALVPTGKSYPPLRQEMQDAFRPEHMRQEAECARVDFPCPSSEQDLRKGKMMTMTLYPPQRGFCIVALAGKPVLLLYYLFSFKSLLLFNEKSRGKNRPPYTNFLTIFRCGVIIKRIGKAKFRILSR